MMENDPREKSVKIISITDYVDMCHKTAKQKGWYPDGKRNIPEALALIHSEVSEALEEYRTAKSPEDLRMHIHCYSSPLTEGREKPEGFDVELADVLIRIFDLCGYLELDLEEALKTKMAYNITREYRHGNKNA